MFSCESCEIFQNTFFTEQFRMNAPDILMQVVVIYNLNLPLQFVALNFIFLGIFTLVHASMSPELLHQFFLVALCLATPCKTASIEK